MQVNSRIEQKIGDIYEFIESCKMQALSSTKVVVPKNELYDLLDDLHRDVPEEIKRYQKILNQRDEILEDAETKASALLLEAEEQYKAMVEEHSIMQQAYQMAEDTIAQANAEADRIIEAARRQADEICNGAVYYTTDMLEMAEKTIARAYESTMNNSRALEKALSGHLDVIRRNKAELTGVEPVSGETEKGDISESEVATDEERTENRYE